MFKNVASQKLMVFAFDSTTNLPKTGDAANITAYVSKDYGTVTVLGDTSATEMDATNAKGYYLFDLTQAETNADTLLFTAKSSTSNIVVIGAPAVVATVPSAFGLVAGASGGILISGSNAGTTTLGALTVTGATTYTGNVSMAAGLTITQSVSNTNAVSITANGSGTGVFIIGGATGAGASIRSGATSGTGLLLTGNTSGVGLVINGAGGSNAVTITGGGAGHGISVGASGTGDGINIAPVGGNGISIQAAGTSKHGMVITGGSSGTSDGIKAVSGTGGVPIRGDITGNITGTLSTVTTLTNLPAITTDWLTAEGVKADAVNKLQAGLSTYAGGPVASVTGDVGGDVLGSATGLGIPALLQIGNIVTSSAVASVTGNVGGHVQGNIGGNIIGNVLGYTEGFGATGIGQIDAIVSEYTESGILDPAGLDSIVIESGMNARQALSIIASSVAGKLAGVTTGNLVFDAANNPGTERISSTVTADGRVTVDLSLPN